MRNTFVSLLVPIALRLILSNNLLNMLNFTLFMDICQFGKVRLQKLKMPHPNHEYCLGIYRHP